MVAAELFAYVRRFRPDLYDAILQKIIPHSLESVIRIFDLHLLRVPDLTCFNHHAEAIPPFVWAFVKHMRFPTPGDAFGILLTCRITQSNTQGMLDSKHLSVNGQSLPPFNVERNILYDLALFSTQLQVFELANRHVYATVFLRHGARVEKVLQWLKRDACVLERGAPFNKGLSMRGDYRYLSTFRYLVVEDRGSVKILYRKQKDLFEMLKNVPLDKTSAFSDVRSVYQKCGIVVYFFNMVELVQRQLFVNDGSAYEHDVLTVIKYQCRSGVPLPMTRDGLAKNPDRTPIEVISFEAIKKNLAKCCTAPERWIPVETSADKVCVGQQPNEGCGYSFAIMPKEK